MRKYLCISNNCRIFASEKETNNKLNPKTRKGTKIMKTLANNIIENGTNVIVTMVDGEKVEGTIVKRNKNLFNDNIYYEVKFAKTYIRENHGDIETFETMDFIPAEAVEKK